MAHLCPHCLSGRPVPLLNSPLSLVLAGSGCSAALALRMLSSANAHPQRHSWCPSSWAPGGLPADQVSEDTASRMSSEFASCLCISSEPL